MSEISDPYVYPGTSVLRNLRDIREQRELAIFESRATLLRIEEMRAEPIDGEFDSVHWKLIHRYIFQDVYPWAGQFRTTLLGKGAFVSGPVMYFTPPHLLEHEAETVFEALRRGHYLTALSRAEFARKAARLLSDLNGIHPFREGNGRTQRIFLEQLANRAGHPLDFDVVSKERMICASILSGKGEPGAMGRLFDEITDPARVEALRRALQFLEGNRFHWNDVYIATTVSGQEYRGRLVGRDLDAFMMRTDREQIVIGRQSDIPSDLRSGEHFSFTAK